MRPSMLGVKDHNGPASVKTECCGNPLRGCEDCPPPKKLTFEEWMYSLGWAYVNAPLTEEDLKTIWKTAQESK